MELDPVDEGLLVDRPRVRGAPAQRFAVGLAGSPDVRVGDLRERDKLDGVDFDHPEPDSVAAALLDLWPLPEADRQGDVAGEDVIAQLGAEVHVADASSWEIRCSAGGLAFLPCIVASRTRGSATSSCTR